MSMSVSGSVPRAALRLAVATCVVLTLSITLLGPAGARPSSQERTPRAVPPTPTPLTEYRSMPVGSDNFVPGRRYRGDFPDPAIVRDGRRWVAYGTTIAALNLPVMTSRDLVHWKARRGNGRRGAWRNEAMPRAARWAETRVKGRKGNRRYFSTTWAPSVTRVGRRFVLAYSTPVRGISPRRLCISMATSRSATGPFVDRSTGPLVCPPDRGAIDPQLFVDPAGVPWLLFKTEQMRGAPSQILSWQLARSGMAFAPGTSPTVLLQTQDAWEGPLIENPSMVVAGGRFLLFYSGGDYGNHTYGTGYAHCAGPAGPCTRASDGPLLASDVDVWGPGGGSAFLDKAGRLRLAYAAWTAGNAGYPTSHSCRRTPAGCAQRRMYIAHLAVAEDGTVVVTRRG